MHAVDAAGGFGFANDDFGQKPNPDEVAEMAEMARVNPEAKLVHRTSGALQSAGVHPAWMRLIRYCAELDHGEIEKLKIQDGVPVVANVVREKVKFT